MFYTGEPIIYFELVAHKSEHHYINNIADFYHVFDTLKEAREEAKNITGQFPIIYIRRIETKEVQFLR